MNTGNSSGKQSAFSTFRRQSGGDDGRPPPNQGGNKRPLDCDEDTDSSDRIRRRNAHQINVLGIAEDRVDEANRKVAAARAEEEQTLQLVNQAETSVRDLESVTRSARDSLYHKMRASDAAISAVEVARLALIAAEADAIAAEGEASVAEAEVNEFEAKLAEAESAASDARKLHDEAMERTRKEVSEASIRSCALKTLAYGIDYPEKSNCRSCGKQMVFGGIGGPSCVTKDCPCYARDGSG